MKNAIKFRDRIYVNNGALLSACLSVQSFMAIDLCILRSLKAFDLSVDGWAGNR